jgi:hypothetical protein
MVCDVENEHLYVLRTVVRIYKDGNLVGVINAPDLG